MFKRKDRDESDGDDKKSKKTKIKVTCNEVESEDEDLDAHVCVTRASDAPIEVSYWTDPDTNYCQYLDCTNTYRCMSPRLHESTTCISNDYRCDCAEFVTAHDIPLSDISEDNTVSIHSLIDAYDNLLHQDVYDEIREYSPSPSSYDSNYSIYSPPINDSEASIYLVRVSSS